MHLKSSNFVSHERLYAMRFPRFILTLPAILAMASTALPHDDVVPYAFNGKILTGGHDDVAGSNNIVQHVFGYDFGEDPEDPYFIGDPGFNNGTFAEDLFPNDGLLPINKTLGFNVLTTLSYWDGNLPVSFVPAPLGVQLGLQRGSTTVNISGTGHSPTVPTIKSTGAEGRVHEHLGSFLNSTDGVDSDPPNAPDGIYMVGIDLKLPDSGLSNSDPIYLVYNNALDEEVHDLAIDWVQENLVVPEPSTWTLMTLAAAALVAAGWRRRRRALPPV
jgi:hypothetical protein